MKRSELYFNVISVPLDFLGLLLAASVAYFLRYRIGAIPVLFDLSYSSYLQLVLIPALFLMLIFALFGLYNLKSTRSFWGEIGKIISAVSLGFMVVVTLFFFDQNLFPSRLIILMAWVLSITVLVLVRGILLVAERSFLKSGIGRHRLIVIKSAIGQNQIVDEIKSDPSLGYEIVGEYEYTQNLGEQIEQLHKRTRVDELLQADPKLPNEQILQLVTLCENLGIKFIYVPTILETRRANIETDVVGTTPVLRLRGTRLDGWARVLKRTGDILVALIALIIFLPFFPFIALAIKLDSSGPLFFHQKRGSSYHNFEFYKFRTMYADSREGPPQEGTPEGDKFRLELEQKNSRVGPYVKIKNDPRITRVGRFLRRTKLDEFPQLLHVLTGKMSIVGPRIHMLTEVEKFEKSQKKIFNSLKPGVTGLAQINQFYDPELPFEEEINYDLFYIENWSLWLDLTILVKTFVLLLTNRPRDNY